eukprot:7297-Prorocentrum_minimum.AAC.7
MRTRGPNSVPLSVHRHQSSADRARAQLFYVALPVRRHRSALHRSARVCAFHVPPDSVTRVGRDVIYDAGESLCRCRLHRNVAPESLVGGIRIAIHSKIYRKKSYVAAETNHAKTNGNTSNRNRVASEP